MGKAERGRHASKRHVGAETRCSSRCKGKGFAEPAEFNSIICRRKSCTSERNSQSNGRQRRQGKAGDGSSSGSQEGKGREGKEGSTGGDSRRGSPQGSSETCTDFPSKGHEVAGGSR